jgi:hypothetical protein
VLVVTKLDRLARSTLDLLRIIDLIGKEGAGFKSLGEAWADTTTSVGKLMIMVLSGIAEFERDLILQRTNVGWSSGPVPFSVDCLGTSPYCPRLAPSSAPASDLKMLWRISTFWLLWITRGWVKSSSNCARVCGSTPKSGSYPDGGSSQ